MATKQVDIAGIGQVTLIKNSRSRSIRLSVTHNGVRVSLPRWTPYSTAIHFVEKQADWVRKELQKYQADPLYENQKIGKLHRLHFVSVGSNASVTSRVTATKITVQLASGEDVHDPIVQKRARTAAIRALRKETIQLLTPRLRSMAEAHGFRFSSVQAKELKRRWGSCDSNRQIVLNLYLMQLPWEQIDYVLYHELTHTEHMNHGSDFWRRLEQVFPKAHSVSKTVRHLQPRLLPTQNATALFDDMAY